MPSGPKKRKAAKRKKNLGLINNNNNNVSEASTSAVAVNSHSHGKEDLIHGGHKETDGGEALRDDDKLDLSYDPPAVDASVHADDMNDSPHQPLVALGPRPAETTSWKNCCGLFEVFTGSNK